MIKSLLSLGLVLIIGAVSFERCAKPKKKIEVKQVSLPLTQVSPENEEWVLYSDFEKVGDTESLYVAEARSEKWPPNLFKLVFINKNLDTPLPKKGEKVRIKRIQMRSNERNVTQHFSTNFLNIVY